MLIFFRTKIVSIKLKEYVNNSSIDLQKFDPFVQKKEEDMLSNVAFTEKNRVGMCYRK